MPTFVVEDGTGLTGANAYASVADVDTYHDDYGAPAAWSSSTTLEKEDAIRLATRYLDATYSSRWRGTRDSRDQPLDWPRTDVVDDDGWDRNDNEILVELTAATAIVALLVRNGESLLPNVTGADQSVISESASVGPISESKSYSGSKVNFTRYSLVDATLRPILQTTLTRERA